MIQSTLRIIGKVLFILFLIWHMFAVAFYSIPREAQDVFSVWTRIDILPRITPYMYATSQWQLWNIFAPDPLRRVTTYKTLMESGNTWVELEAIGPKSFSSFRHADQLKMMGNLMDDQKTDRGPFAGRFLELKCAEYHVPSGTRVRLMYSAYVLPYLTSVQSGTWWDEWTATSSDAIGYTITCP